MVWEPVVKELFVILAWLFTKVPVPIMVPPSKNVTVPVALVGAVAVKVTGWLTVEGFSDEVSVISGAVFTTVTETAGEVAGLLVVSPGVVAVIWSVPSGRFVTVMVATPFTIGAVPIGVVPL
jgi:hypothetical protein